MAESSFFISYFLAAVVIGWGAYYFYKYHKEHLGEMDKMMGGMVFGTLTGLVYGAIYGVSTGDYLWATIFGTLAGLLVGVPLANAAGGGLTRLEAIMGAAMGGLMGAMLGFMIRPFDLRIFMVFLFSLLMLISGEMSYHVYKLNERKTPKLALYLAALIGVSILGVTAIQDYSVDFNRGIGLQTGSNALPQQVEAKTIEGSQEINLQATFQGYSPSTIVLKKGVPVTLNFGADASAGCARALQMPEFGINTVVKPGEVQQLKFTPQEGGTFDFYCAMRMFRGKIVVQ